LINIFLIIIIIKFLEKSQEVKIHKLCEEINEQVEKNDTLATENETLTTENSELEGQLETLQREVEELKKETEMLHGKVNKLQQRNVVLCETLEEFLSLRVKRRKISSPLDEPVDHGHNLRPTTRVNYAGMDSTKEEETSDEEYTQTSNHKSST
jgi:predicted nuclease with TOPRIM domain